MLRNHYGITIDSGKPITGVFQNNYLEWLDNDLDNSDDLSWYTHLDECSGNETGDHDHCYYSDGSETRLIGFTSTNTEENSWYWFPNQGIGFFPDPDAEYSAIVGEVYTQVVASKWRIKCALCSPCYPGQGDANTPGDFLAYSLPPDVIGDGELDKRRVFLAD